MMDLFEADEGGAAGAAVEPAASRASADPSHPRRLLFFDTETTGFAPKRDRYSFNDYHPPQQYQRYDRCRLLSLALVVVDTATGKWETFSTLIKPEEGVVADPGALAVNKLSMVRLASCEADARVPQMHARRLDLVALPMPLATHTFN